MANVRFWRKADIGQLSRSGPSHCLLRRNNPPFPGNIAPVASKVPICLNGTKQAVGAGVSETEQAGPSLQGPSAAAVGVALAGADREEANSFLRKQAALTDLLMDEIKEENPLKLSHLRIRRFGDYAKMGFEISVGLLVLALVAGISLMVWNAAHSDGLIIESFSVPPGLASQGVTGQVIATQVLDKLTVMQNETRSGRPAKSYANNWGDDIKVEIPDTGMSVGELYRFLRGWLGHETHISGEVTATATGLAVTARAGGNPGATFTGAEAELDKIIQQAAEHVYRSTQTYRYGIYLRTHGRIAEAVTLFKALAAKGPALERSWGYGGWSSSEGFNLSDGERKRLLQRAVALNPDNFVAYTNLAGLIGRMGATEEAYQLDKKLPALRPGFYTQVTLAADLGAYREATELLAATIESGDVGGMNNPHGVVVIYATAAHDIGTARRHLPDAQAERSGAPDQDTLYVSNLKRGLAFAAEDWVGLIAEAEATASLRRKYVSSREREATFFTPQIAYARARLGDIAGAQRLIAATPGDCYFCLRMRGRIAQEAKADARADFWFARAAAAAPSLPFAHAEWGEALLKRGKPDDAIENFKIANQRGPHFADPIEMWGEALMAKNQSHRALAKFAEAEKYAPNWGRLHLKWGEALVYAGKKDEATKHFTRAAQLDLTSSEKAELARHP